MKIDFENFKLYDGIDKIRVMEMDVRRVFADEIYNRGQGIDCHALALKIYNSNGPEEYGQEECMLMTAFAEQCMTPRFIDSLKEAMEVAGP